MLITRLTTRRDRLRQIESGFTLLELLVVLLVIAILAAIALPIFINQQKIAVDASVKSDVRNTASTVGSWVANHPGVAAANTKAYTDAPNSGKIVETSDHTVLGIVIKANGQYTICGFNDGGGKYEKAEDSWGFQSATGQFSQVTSESCEGAVDADGRDISTTPSDPTFLGSDTLPNGVQNEQYTATIDTRANPAATFSLKSGSNLPLGLTLSTSGAISGKPQVTGAFNFTILAENTTGKSERQYKLTISQTGTIPVWSTNAALPDATRNSPYTTTLKATGSPSPTYKVTVGNLPAGLALDETTGVLAGTPTATGYFVFTVSAINSKSSSPNTFFLNVAADTTPPVWTSNVNLPGATKNSAYTTTVAATGDPQPTYALASGSTLPAGLTLNATTGVISGTPTVYGPFVFTLNATNANSSTPTSFFLTIADDTTAPVWTTNASLPDGTKGSAYTTTVNATGKPTPTYQVAPGSILPAGLSLNMTTGEISGTPLAATSFVFTLSAVNSNSSVDQAFFMTVAKNTTPPAWTTNVNLPAATQGSAYTTTVAATGDPTPTYAVATGSTLPAGLSLNATTGVLSGTPTTANSYAFTLNAINSNSTTPVTFFLTVGPATIAPAWTSNAQLPNGTQSASYSATVNATGTPTPTYALATGSKLPTGMSLNATTGKLGGTPSVSGSFTFTINAKNSNSTVGQAFFLTLAPAVTAPAWQTDPSLPNAQQDTAYSTTVVATGNPTPTYAIATGSALPTGLKLNTTTGVISGTPDTQSYGSYVFTVNAKNSKGTTQLAFYLTIDRIYTTPLWQENQQLASGHQGTPYSTTVVATGTPTPTYYIPDGQSLPDGLSLNTTTGEISGTPTGYSSTPTSANSFIITIGAINKDSSAEQAFFLDIGEDTTPPVFSTPSLPQGQIGESYSTTVIVTGKPQPYFVSMTGFDGVGLDQDGNLNGTPTKVGTNTVVITAQNDDSTVSKTYTVTVIAAPTISVNTQTLPTAQETYDYNSGPIAVTTARTTGTTQFSIANLPYGMDFDPNTGAITGNPPQGYNSTANGYPSGFPLSVTATNGNATSAAKTLYLKINPYVDPTLTPSNTSTYSFGSKAIGATASTAYSGYVTVGGTYNATTTKVTASGLPSWAVLNYSTSTKRVTITGSPTGAAVTDYPFTLTADDGHGTAATNTFYLTVSQPAAVSYSAATLTANSSWFSPVTVSGNNLVMGASTVGFSYPSYVAGGVYTVIITATPRVGASGTTRITDPSGNNGDIHTGEATGSKTYAVTFTAGSGANTLTLNGFTLTSSTYGNITKVSVQRVG